jgi:HAD superfamily hydrolase (TIGR01509 family)
MIAAALVDLDGTLVDSHAANQAAYRQALDDLAVPYSLAALRQYAGTLAWRPMLARVAPDADAQTHAAIAQRKRAVYPSFFPMVQVNDTLLAILKTLKPHAKLALVTSASRASVDPLLTALSLAPLFDLTITSDDVTAQKPDPEPYRLAAARLGVQPTDCLVFEDSEIGLQSAKAFGAQVWQVHWSPDANLRNNGDGP